MTTQKILVDTDVLIDFLRERERAKQILEGGMQKGSLHSSVVTLAELLAGMRPEEKEATEALVEGLILLPVTETIARRAGALRRQVGSKKILLPDCLIAATALEDQCLLMTFNQKDYRFPNLLFYS